MAERKLHRARVDVRPRFRCLVCKRFVHGTEHGTCPQCGWEPPTAAPPARERRDSWAGVAIILLLFAIAALLGWIPPGR